MAEEKKSKICVIGEARFLEPLIHSDASSSEDHRYTIGVGFYNYENKEAGITYLPSSTEIGSHHEPLRPYFYENMDEIAAADIMIIAVSADQTTPVIEKLERAGFNRFTSEKGSILIRGDIDQSAKEILRRHVGEEKVLHALSPKEVKTLFQAAQQSYSEFEKKRNEIVCSRQDEDVPIGDKVGEPGGTVEEKPKLQSNKMRFFAYSGCALVAAGGVGALAFAGILTSPLFIITLTALSVVAAIVFLVLAYRESKKEVRQEAIEMSVNP